MPRSAIRDGMIAVDLSSYPFESDFLREVHALGGVAVSSREIFLRAMRTILHAYTGRSFSDAELTAGIPEEDWPDELLAGAVS
jgi:hypothetical protein